MGQSVSAKIVFLAAAVSFLAVILVSAGHLHLRANPSAVKTECQLCSLAQTRIDLSRTAPVLLGLAAVAWGVSRSRLAAPCPNTADLPPPRAPPVR